MKKGNLRALALAAALAFAGTGGIARADDEMKKDEPPISRSERRAYSCMKDMDDPVSILFRPLLCTLECYIMVPTMTTIAWPFEQFSSKYPGYSEEMGSNVSDCVLRGNF